MEVIGNNAKEIFNSVLTPYQAHYLLKVLDSNSTNQFVQHFMSNRHPKKEFMVIEKSKD